MNHILVTACISCHGVSCGVAGCGRHNSPPASSAMDLVLCCLDSSHVSVDKVHPSLLWSSSSSSPRLYSLQCLSSDVLPLYGPNHLNLYLSVMFSVFNLSLTFLTWSLRGFAKKEKFKKSEITMEAGWVGPGLTQNFCFF